MKFLNLQQKLSAWKEQDLYRQRKTVSSPQQTEICVDGKTLVNFASNDYLGLANNLAAINALKVTADEYGFGGGASHMICGHQQPHQKLEEALASFVGRESVITFSSGYIANLSLLQSLATKGDVIIADKLNHASLIDGVRLSEASSSRYQHLDLSKLSQRLSQTTQNKFVVTDSVFSMDGDLAPLKEIAQLCEKHNAILIVDDAHGFGVLGQSGRGCIEHFNLSQKQLPVYMATLSKALGGYGAFVAGEKKLTDFLLQFARGYIYTTAMPAAIASANLANLNYLKSNLQLNTQLHKNIQLLKQLCQKNAIKLLKSKTAIQPIVIGSSEKLLKINKRLLDAGYLLGAIRPPTVSKNSARLRITLSAQHNQQQIEKLVAVLAVALNSQLND